MMPHAPMPPGPPGGAVSYELIMPLEPETPV